MELRVIGCHGGETPKHKTCAFVVDDVLAIDAGSLTSGLDLTEQARLEACLVSHAHLDHIRDLATLADNRCQLECPPLIVASSRETLRALRKHFFNNIVWPDFTTIPTPDHPTLRYLELKPERPTLVANKTVRAIGVTHTIDAVAFLINGTQGSIAYSGDTGPTERLWQVLNEQQDLKALLMEVSFPNREQQLATISGHHTPKTLDAELRKYRAPKELPTLLYHIKPVFQSEVEKECAALQGLNMEVLQPRDHFIL